MKEKLFQTTFGELKFEDLFYYKGDKLMKFGNLGMGINAKGSVVEQIAPDEPVQLIQIYFEDSTPN